ncbi:GNAT family N-acetyltransferase [Paenibacillus campi]|uniref:GNAT family N-acetyltransferase n=1 Tax=Paenibacillus campi TaxID=3106031 RepID=UPI002AFF8A6A|nr:GNAT family N-acetyltransferase [Paenibacillus sp. SGZ-1014]
MDQQTLIIREAKQEDVQALVDLMEQLGYPVTEDAFRNRFAALQEHEDYQMYIAESDGQVVGTIGLIRELRFERDGVHVRVGSLVVDEQYRGSGIGRSLLLAAEGWAGTVGARAMALNSGNREERTGAHNFYRHLGYTGTSTGFVKLLT